jgi:serine/threonine-protein kinase SRPK3
MTTDQNFEGVIQPVALRAPEVILGIRWDTPVDIWSAGCLVRLS